MTHLRGDRNSFMEKGMSEKQPEFQQVEKERRNIMSQDCDGGTVGVHWRVRVMHFRWRTGCMEVSLHAKIGPYFKASWSSEREACT